MSQPYYKKSEITGRTYDLFNVVRILNLYQVMHYVENNVPLEDIEVSQDRKTGSPILVFLFDKMKSYTAYDSWCNKKKENMERGIPS